MSYRPRKQQGYIALIALLVVAAAGLTIGLSVSLRGIDEVQLSFGTSQAARARSAASACLEEGLERLRRSWADFSTTLSVNGNSCIITVTTTVGSATAVATGTTGIYNHTIQAVVGTDLSVTAWQEE